MATGRAIDHVVLAVRDLDRAAKTYQQLGFTLTPRAMHEDRMGTSNRLAQFQGRNFIELLAVDRPAKLQPHDLAATPPFFSFGDHNRLAVKEREGLSMLVFASNDAKADIARFEAAGLTTSPPFEFERQAVLPDGSRVTVAFSLAFAWSAHMPKIGFFACQNRAEQYFWKPEYQTHANGARSIQTVYLASPSSERDAAFIGAMFGGEILPIPGGWRVSCGASQEVHVLDPAAIAARDGSLAAELAAGPMLAGIRLVAEAGRDTIASTAACGMFIERARA